MLILKDTTFYVQLSKKYSYMDNEWGSGAIMVNPLSLSKHSIT